MDIKIVLYSKEEIFKYSIVLLCYILEIYWYILEIIESGGEKNIGCHCWEFLQDY